MLTFYAALWFNCPSLPSTCLSSLIDSQIPSNLLKSARSNRIKPTHRFRVSSLAFVCSVINILTLLCESSDWWDHKRTWEGGNSRQDNAAAAVTAPGRSYNNLHTQFRKPKKPTVDQQINPWMIVYSPSGEQPGAGWSKGNRVVETFTLVWW